MLIYTLLIGSVWLSKSLQIDTEAASRMMKSAMNVKMKRSSIVMVYLKI